MENEYKDDLMKESEELNAKEYLGTFRWKKSLKFPNIPYKKIDYSRIASWSEYIESRIEGLEIEPYVTDALSYPLSIIHALVLLNKDNLLNKGVLSDKTVNIVIIGAANKTEQRICLESNYFDEIYHYIASINSNSTLAVNVYFVGEEVKETLAINKFDNKLNYKFSNLNTGDFLKANAFDLNKANTLFAGLNCGFGAGYEKLAISWVKDLIILLKFNYEAIFTFTNDYEDYIGETSILELLSAKFLFKLLDNPFKSMTTYTSEENPNVWSCGNYGIYAINGSVSKEKLNSLSKLDNKAISQELININIKFK